MSPAEWAPAGLVTPTPEQDAFLARVLAAAPACGITRLADITRLDRIGLPVWQAVRPAGRALSVHQGKGASPAAARIGALCEAIESDCAESAPADGARCAWADLSSEQRSPALSDFCRVRDRCPAEDEPLQWCVAEDCLTGRRLALPHPLVSLDFTQGLPSLFDRTSTGLGAGPSESAALQIALLELVERDAVGAWRRLAPLDRMATAIRLDTIALPWLQSWLDRLRGLAVEVAVFEVASFTGIPVFHCVIGGQEAFGDVRRSFFGDAAHPDTEISLFKAFAEAVQSRLTFIAGVRDDILPSHYAAAAAPSVGACLPPRRCWPEREPAVTGWESIAERLAARGYRQIAFKRLDRGLDGIAVTKAFVPGLGSLSRTRRAPA